MESFVEQFYRETEIYRTGPILYRARPDLMNVLSDIAQKYAGTGIPDTLVKTLTASYAQVHSSKANNEKDEYDRAYEKLRADIATSVLVRDYKRLPTVEKFERIVSYFSDVAPQPTIVKLAELLDNSKLLWTNDVDSLGEADYKELHEVVRILKAIEVDEPNQQTAVEKVQRTLDGINNLVVAWVVLIGFTPEGFVFDLKGQDHYVYDRTLTALVYQGLTLHLPFKPDDGAYALWYSMLYSYAAASHPLYIGIFNATFPLPSKEVFDTLVPGEYQDVVQLAGEAYAALCSVYKTEAMQQMILPRLAHLYITALAVEQQPLDLPFRKWAWAKLPMVSRAATGVFENVARWVYATKKLASTYSAPVTIVSPLIGLIYTSASAAYEFIDKAIDVFVYGLNKFAPFFTNWFREYLYLGRAYASVVLPGSRRRPKSVWALLFVNDFTRLDPGTKFALSCSVMQLTPSPTFTEWETRFHQMINESNMGDYKLYHHEPLRPLRLPKDPLTVDEEVLKLAPLFEGNSRHTDIMAEKLEKWRMYNVPQGIDQQWFATPDRVGQSLRRYDVERAEPNEYTSGLVREAAHALANKYPEMYKNYQYFTLKHAMRRLKWDTNMSPGLGFIGNVKTRKLLRRHGFLDAILHVAHKRLEEGFHPGTVAHAFVKEQVLSLEKLLKGKNIRTVTAMDLMSNTLALPFSIELSRAPPPEAYVLNALPRSEGGYRPFFDDLRRHSVTLQADASEFDSKLAPVITVEGLAELRSIGFESNPALPIIESQIRAHYHHMRHANLVDLTTGTVYNKTGGMMTGQVNTSYDNRDAFRLMIIAAWSDVTGKSPSEFWDENTLGNAGDDDAIGTELGQDVWDKIFKRCTELFGTVVNLEEVGWSNLSLTALQPVSERPDTAYYRHMLGMPAVDYGIRTEPAKLLLTKTEFRARHARLRDIPFRQAHVDSMVGTAYLSAYNNDIYEDLAELYKADVNYVLLRFYEKVEVTETRDRFGNLSHLSLKGANIRKRYKSKANQIDDMMNSWLKRVKWPSMQRVFNIWVQPYTPDRSNIVKHYKHLVSGGPGLSAPTRLLYGLVGVREGLLKLPNHVVRALPEFPGADISVTLKTPEFIIERFVWLSLFHKLKSIPTKSAFMSALREGPYAAAASPVDFLEFLEEENYMRELIADDLELLRGQAIMVTLIYSFLEVGLNRLAQTPLLGLIITLYALATRDVNRLYATTNHIYWLAEGRSSAVISNLMPSDPYAWMKQIAVILTSGVPKNWLAIPGLKHLTTWAPSLVEAWVLSSVTLAPNVGRIVFKEPPLNSPWASVIDGLLAIRADTQNFSVTVVAPTGSGKSTLFVALLASVFPGRKIWLCHPTVAARDEYVNSFLPGGTVQILRRGITLNNEAFIYSVTYGYFNQIINNVSENDIILLDEIHLSTTESWSAWWSAHRNIRICLTATPKYTLQPKTDHHLNYPGARRFKMKMTYVNQTIDQLLTTLINTRPTLMVRALIICPTKASVEYVRNTLSRLSYSSSELSSDNPVPARTGIIVATSIADQALTIEPPPTTVIDMGTMLQVSVESKLGDLFPHHETKIVPVSQEVADQRAGRGGRSFDSEGFGLLNSPRSPHMAPARFPGAVFAAPIVAEQVMLSLNLRNLLVELNTQPSLLRFVQLSTYLDASLNVHDVAVAALMLLYLSSGSTMETFTVEFYNLKFASLESDSMRVNVSNVVGWLPEAIPVLGDVHRAQSLLHIGIFNCKVGARYIPVAAFLFISGWLCPVGSDPAMLFDPTLTVAIPSLSPPKIARGVDHQRWLDILAMFEVKQLKFSQLLKLPDIIPMALYHSVEMTSTNFISSADHYIFQMTRQSTHARILQTNLVNCIISPSMARREMTNILLSVVPAQQPISNTFNIDVAFTGYQFSSLFPILILIASALDDSRQLVAGALSMDVVSRPMLRNDKILVWGPPEDIISVLISPLAARLVVPWASQATSHGSIIHFKSLMPIVVMSGLEDFDKWSRLGFWPTTGQFVGNRVALF